MGKTNSDLTTIYVSGLSTSASDEITGTMNAVIERCLALSKEFNLAQPNAQSSCTDEGSSVAMNSQQLKRLTDYVFVIVSYKYFKNKILK